MGETESDKSDQIPPAREGEINQIPSLDVGDIILVETGFDYAPDRKLTVSEVGTSAQGGDIVSTRGDDDGYVLRGYGTEYHLITTGTRHWRRVDIVFDSRPEGQIVSNIEVLHRAASVDGDRA